MLLRPDQVSELLSAAEASGKPIPRLREKLIEHPDNDAHHAELAALIAALSVGDAIPEEPEQGPQPVARADVHCLLDGGHQLMIECLHVGSDLTMHDRLRPPLFVAFDQRLREELNKRHVSGNTISLSYPREATCDRNRVPPRDQFDEVFGSRSFTEFAEELKRAADGAGTDDAPLWHVESYGFFVEARGYGTVLTGQLPPDFQDHPVYRGIKGKMRQVAKVAKPAIPIVLLCVVTNATPVVRAAALRGVDSRRACLAAFGVAGEGQMIATRGGLVTHGRIQGSERVAAVMVIEVDPPNCFPTHKALNYWLNPHATHKLREVHVDALRQMVLFTHHATSVDAATLVRQIPLRREAIAWNAKPLRDRVAEMPFAEAGESSREPTGELQRLLSKGHRLSWSDCQLEVWPFGIVRDERRQRRA